MIGSAVPANVLNPKLTLFFFAFLPQFVAPHSHHELARPLVLSATFMAMTFIVFVIYGVGAAAVRHHVIDRPHTAQHVRRVFAASFVGRYQARHDLALRAIIAGQRGAPAGAARPPALVFAAGGSIIRRPGSIRARGGVAELGFGVPDPELVEQAKRRKFTARYKLEILEQAEACTRPGEIGELLRREGLSRRI